MNRCIENMDKYKIFLVDDEEDVRRAIVRKLDWNALGYEMTGEASNGVEALEMIETLAPDVLMADIRMPFMDGLELCRRAKEILPDIKFVIFSGFDEFDYAREAIKLDVVEYIMKPIDAEELSNVLRRISHTLRRETAERLDIERIRRSYEESLPLLRQQLLSQLISGGTVDRELLTEAGLDFNAERYGVAVIKFNVQDATRELSRDETRLLPLSLQQLITDNLEEQSDFHLIHFPDHIVLLMLMSKDEGMRDMLHMLSRLVTPSLKLLNLKLYIGVGKSRTRTEDVYLSYEEALDALEYSRSLDDGQVMYIGDIVPGRRRGNHRLSTFINEIQKCVMTGNRERLEKAVDALTADFAQHPPTRLQYDYFLFELGAELNRLIQIYELDYDEDSNLVDALLRKKYSRDFDAGVLKTAIMACADLIRKKIKTKRKDSTSQLVADAQAFISEHYADPTLSLDQLCKALNVSQSYFSSVFKKAMGSSFVSRLTEVRMQAAAALLEATDLKTYAIAEKVGYADSNYFSYVFKKHVGLSPTVYRAERLKDME